VADVEEMLKSYRVYFRKVEPEDGGERYLMDHSASFYLLDDSAELAGLLNYNATADEALAKIRKLVAQS
jgi:protein SCO1/2